MKRFCAKRWFPHFKTKGKQLQTFAIVHNIASNWEWNTPKENLYKSKVLSAKFQSVLKSVIKWWHNGARIKKLNQLFKEKSFCRVCSTHSARMEKFAAGWQIFTWVIETSHINPRDKAPFLKEPMMMMQKNMGYDIQGWLKSMSILILQAWAVSMNESCGVLCVNVGLLCQPIMHIQHIQLVIFKASSLPIQFGSLMSIHPKP